MKPSELFHRRGTSLPHPSAFVVFAGLLCTIAGVIGAAPNAKDLSVAKLFAMTNVWPIHLKFTAEEWKAIEPAGGGGGFGAMFLGGGRGAGPAQNAGGGRGAAPGGAASGNAFGFGSSMILAPAFMQGDQDRNSMLTRAEFLSLGEKWFADLDAGKTEELKADQARTRLDSVLQPASAQPGAQVGGGGGGFGGFGGGAGGGRGMLQGAEGQRNGLSSAMGIEFDYVHADLEFDGSTFTKVGIRYKGNGTYLQAGGTKRPLKLDLNKFVKGQKIASVTKLNLHNNVTDAGWMNEVLALRLFQDAGVASPRASYAQVFVTVPGTYNRQYFGLYSLVENVDHSFFDERIGSKSGAIFKPSTPAPFTDLGNDWKAYQQPYDPKTGLTDAQKQRLIELCRLVSHANDSEFAAKIGDYLDFDNFARFLAVTVYLASTDSIIGVGQNYYVYLHPQSQKFQFIPWDHDHSFGNFGGAAENMSINPPWQAGNRFMDRLFAVAAFRETYRAKLAEFSKTIFDPARIARQVDEIAQSIRPAVRAESEEKLAAFERAAAGESAAATGFGGGKPIKTFVVARTQSIIDQLAGKAPPAAAANQFGFGGGGRGGGRGGGFGGLNGLVATSFLTALDPDQNSVITRTEFAAGFASWFDRWDTAKSGELTEPQLREGIDQEFPLDFANFGNRGGAPARGQ